MAIFLTQHQAQHRIFILRSDFAPHLGMGETGRAGYSAVTVVMIDGWYAVLRMRVKLSVSVRISKREQTGGGAKNGIVCHQQRLR